MNNTIRIGLLDETSKDLLAIKKLIINAMNYQLIFEVWKWDDLKDKLKLQTVDLLILNLQLTLLNGAQSIQELKAQIPNKRIILYALYEQPKILYTYLDLGINGIILKHFTADQICKTIDGVYKKGYFYCKDTINKISLYQDAETKTEPIELSDTELKIIKGICNEMTSAAIGEKIFLSSRTIDWHRIEIKRKIGVKSTVGIVKYAIAVGIFVL